MRPSKYDGRDRSLTITDYRIEPCPTTGCWLWTGELTVGGYGHAWHPIKKRRFIAHRAFYEAAHGPIPPGLLACHHCDTRICVNPDHIFIGTVQDNALDAARKGRIAGQRQAHCKYGHPFVGGNVIRRNVGTQRGCRECNRRHNVEYRARKKARFLAEQRGAER